MSTFYLLNTTTVGTTKYFAGTLIDDSHTTTASITAVGGVLVNASKAQVAAAAAVVATRRAKRAISEDEANALMFAAAHAVMLDPSVKGADLTDTSTQTIQSSEGGWRKLPTLSQGGVLTLGTTGAEQGDQIEVTRTDTSAFTYAVANGGVGSGTLVTFAVSKQSSAKFQFNGTDWELRSCGTIT